MTLPANAGLPPGDKLKHVPQCAARKLTAVSSRRSAFESGMRLLAGRSDSGRAVQNRRGAQRLSGLVIQRGKAAKFRRIGDPNPLPYGRGSVTSCGMSVRLQSRARNVSERVGDTATPASGRAAQNRRGAQRL
jgi:hypothetical protein